MKKNIFFLFCGCIYAGLTLFYSCTKDTAPVPSPAPVCDSTKISYTKTIAPMMANNCTSCHNSSYGQGANDLTTYNQVKAGVEDSTTLNSIICRSTPGQTCGQDLMPKGSRFGLSQPNRDTLEMWKLEGFCN